MVKNVTIFKIEYEMSMIVNKLQKLNSDRLSKYEINENIGFKFVMIYITNLFCKSPGFIYSFIAEIDEILVGFTSVWPIFCKVWAIFYIMEGKDENEEGMLTSNSSNPKSLDCCLLGDTPIMYFNDFFA
jgi:hypothetical protein